MYLTLQIIEKNAIKNRNPTYIKTIRNLNSHTIKLLYKKRVRHSAP